MIAQILAQTGVTTPPDPFGPYLPYLIIGAIVMGLSTLGNLFLIGKQLVGGNKGERKIEPTELHAINTKLDAQTDALNKLGREQGETTVAIQGVRESIEAQQEQVNNAFTRINAISTESAATKARVEDHLQDHRRGRFDA